MKFGLSQIHQPTPAKMAKLGMILVGVSSFIAGYGLIASMPIAGYIGLGSGILGTVLTNLFGANEKS